MPGSETRIGVAVTGRGVGGSGALKPIGVVARPLLSQTSEQLLQAQACLLCQVFDLGR